MFGALGACKFLMRDGAGIWSSTFLTFNNFETSVARLFPGFLFTGLLPTVSPLLVSRFFAGDWPGSLSEGPGALLPELPEGPGALPGRSCALLSDDFEEEASLV